MRLNRTTVIVLFPIAAAVALLATHSAAADPQGGDAQRGARIVATGTDHGVVPCARCHAFDGAADGSGAFPKLSGLPSYYLAKELRDFASRKRDDAIMSAIASRMTAEDIADVSAYYSGVQGTATPPPAAQSDLLALGARLATVGDDEKRIQACEGCHGPHGRGEAPAIPPLAGQYAHYIQFQMRMWQKGYRKNDANRQMANIAAKLGPKEVEALGLYFERFPQRRATNKWRQP